MLPKTILITGASGNIGHKLREHFYGLQCNLVLLDADSKQDPNILKADLSHYDESWAKNFSGVDSVIHLAGDSNAWASWASAYRNNWLVTQNILRAASEHAVKRFIFASSNWVMAGYRSGSERLATGLPPKPINPYGIFKLQGECLGRAYADRGLSFIAFRIGWCQPTHNNQPGPHMGSRWEQLKWLSDRDMCQAMECAVEKDVGFAVLNLMSNNPGMRWDITETTNVIGYYPHDGAAAIVTPSVRIAEWKEYMRYKFSPIDRPSFLYS